MTSPRKVSVVIASWNGRPHLETCLDALDQQSDPGVPWEVLVWDNGSHDGTSEWIESSRGSVRSMRSPVNLGFAAANNRLIAKADGDFVALLNNDTRPERDWLAALVEALSQAPADVAAVSGLMLDWDGVRLDAAKGVMTFDGHAFQLDAGRRRADVELPANGSELPFFCGGNAIVRRDAFLSAGGFDEDYFAYYEDVDLGWRLWSGGARVLFTADAVVGHRSAASSDRLGVYNRGFLYERNAFLTAYKNYEDHLWQRVMPAVQLTLLARTQALLQENNPGGHLLRLTPFPPEDRASAESEMRSRPELESGHAPTHRDGNGGRPGVTKRASKVLRGIRRLVRRDSSQVQLSDERTLAQLRAVSSLLANLDQAARKRCQAQKARRRSDREFFERFPAYLVPTYPGDTALFASMGFRSWLPADLPLVEKRLDEILAC